jgi:hypothetical protein
VGEAIEAGVALADGAGLGVLQLAAVGHRRSLAEGLRARQSGGRVMGGCYIWGQVGRVREGAMT